MSRDQPKPGIALGYVLGNFFGMPLIVIVGLVMIVLGQQKTGAGVMCLGMIGTLLSTIYLHLYGGITASIRTLFAGLKRGGARE